MTNRSWIGSPLVAGIAEGLIVASDEPLSLWGGLDPDTGAVIDRRHPLVGIRVTGAILSLPFGRGSCSASGVLLEAIHHDTAPAAFIVSEIDPIIGLGAILGDELLHRVVPVVLMSDEDRRSIPTGLRVRIENDGRVTQICQ
ncbi:hypothetical protein BH23CHL5_BH23CHL5_22760 [soil metagenome]